MTSNNAVYYPCKYVPVELLAGFGAACWPCTDEPDDFQVAERVGHPNLCGYGKGLLNLALSGEVHALVLTTCCDVMRRVYDILQAEDTIEFLFLLDLPHHRGPAEVARFKQQLKRLAQAYAAYAGTSFDISRALAACVPPLPRTDERVTLMGAHVPLSLENACKDSLTLHVRNISCTGHERWVPEPPASLARAPKNPANLCTACESLVGVQQESTGSGTAANGAGESSARSDSDTPYATQSENHTGDGTPSAAQSDLDRFLDWYADALLNQLPCTRMADVSERRGLLEQEGQRGAIYHTMKFCDYYGLEYADLAQKSGLPVLKVETDGTQQSAGQLKTRLEAFNETLGGATMLSTSANKQTAAHTGSAAGNAQQNAQPSSTDTATTADRSNIYVLGLDSGSTSTDAVILDGQGHIVASCIVPTGAKATAGAQKALEQVLAQANITRDQLAYCVATGYGRNAIPHMDAAVTEITCHARGAHMLAPQARTIIDIGGQDSKVIHLNADGTVANFVMNDKCAAGTGRFLEVTARALELSLEDFCKVGLNWKHPVQISSMCTVFAESEVVSLVASDTPVADIVHGLDSSVASKTAALAKRVSAEPPYLMTGGVAQNEGVVRALEETLGAPVATHPNSQLCGAIGAALFALESV